MIVIAINYIKKNSGKTKNISVKRPYSVKDVKIKEDVLEFLIFAMLR